MSEITKVFDIQNEIAQSVATKIQVVIKPEEQQSIEAIPTYNSTAYDFYLQAEEEFDIWVKTSDTTFLNNALLLYESAIAQDSTFAEAYLGLSSVFAENLSHNDLYFKNVWIDSCLSLIDIALSYNDQLERAYLFLGVLKGFYLGDIDQGLSYLERALEINPNYAEAYKLKAALYSIQADVVNEIQNNYMALKLDKTYWKPSNLGSIKRSYVAYGFYDKASYYATEKLKLDADSINYLQTLASVEFLKGNIEKSLSLHKKVYLMDSTKANLNSMIQITTLQNKYSEALEYAIIYDSLIVQKELLVLNHSHRVGYAYWINGYEERAKHYFDKQLKNCQESIKMKRPYGSQKNAYYDLACLHAFYGDKENAFQALEEFNSKRFVKIIMLRWLETDPLLNSIRKDERFQKIYNDIRTRSETEQNRLRAWMNEEGII